MRLITRILLIISVLFLTVQSQPTNPATADSSCPLQGCTIFLPAVQNGKAPLKIALVTDIGGINDAGFNAGAWQALLDANANYGAVIGYRESTSTDEFASNIQAFISEGYNLIVTVGFTMGDATLAAATAHPTQKFSIADFSYDPVVPNILGQLYATEQPAFLAGYLAAGMTQTGKVATFGGWQIPTVVQFMNGYYQGVQYYNQQKGTTVEVLGWNPSTNEGVFVNDFGNIALGKTTTEVFFASGADIVFPVAGLTGVGALQAAQEHPGTWGLGVDTDWKVYYPEYNAVLLTSVIKSIRPTTYGVITKVYQGTFIGGNYMGTLANQGAILGTIDSAVPQALLDELEVIKAGIISGSIVVTP